ncbi:ATP-binding protein [Rubrivivax sp. RP6-9]|uniref:ATP-binding protein n=1 Tax=Rubrivivax sp. RP6-9 TaxID=3415750 RepID=UPI003CC67108
MPDLQLHGPPHLRFDDGRALALSPREAALLAWLHLEGRTPRAVLAARLWPGGDDAKARANLRQTLLRLRRGAGALLHEDGRGLALADGVVVQDAAGARLLGALEFDDAPELADWLAQRRDATQRHRLRELLAAARVHLAQGALDAALAAADALLATDPAIEEAHRVRMEVFYLRGDRAAAIAAWDACRDAVRSAFGVMPADATDALGRLLLTGDAPAAPAAHAALPAALRRPPQLVGRDAVLAAVLQSLALGHTVVLAGAGGIGKSRLLAEAVARALPAGCTLSVGARPGDVLQPGALLARLLAAALQQCAPHLDPATQADVQCLLPAPGDVGAHAASSALAQRRLLGTLPRVLQACHARGLRLVAIDDLHCADEPSLEALQLLLGAWRAAGDTLPLLLLGLRPDEAPPAAQAVLALLAQLADGGRSARFELAPLQVADVQTLLAQLPWSEHGTAPDTAALAAALVAQVGGNPAFLLESLKSLWLAADGALQQWQRWQPGQPLPVPPTLREAVRQRLQRLPGDALQLAQIAAVAGGDFSLPLAAAHLQRTPLQLAPLLTALEAAQVFDGLGFAHDLVAEAVLASLPTALRPLLHGSVAEHLATHGGSAAAVAHHLQQAGRPEAAAPWWLQAARQAQARWQMAAAAAAYQAAAPALPTRAGQRDAWMDATRCWLWVRHAAAADTLAAAAALADGPADAARLRTLRTIWCFNTRRLAEAVDEATVLVDDLLQHGSTLAPAVLADALRVITSLVASGLDIERALALVPHVAPLVQHDADARLALHTAHGGLLHWAAQPLPAAQALETALQQAAHGGDPGPRVVLANQLMRVRHALGDLDGAAALGAHVLQRAAPLEMGLVFQTDVMHVVAMVDMARGRAAAGLARFDVLLRRLADAQVPVPDLFLTSQALLLIACGRLAEAEAVLQRHPPAGRPGQALQDLGLHLTRARLATLQGRPAGHWLALAAAPLPLPPGLVLQRAVVLASLQGGDAHALDALAAELGRRGMRGLQRVAAQAAARAALAAGDTASAVQHVQQALALAGAVDAWDDEPASVWHTAAEVLAACGDAGGAAAAAARGAAWVRAGAAQWSDPAHRQAWLHGNPVHRDLLRQAASPAG